MSSVPPPSGPPNWPPSGYPPGYRPPPQRYRPSAWWFVLGGGLVVLAVLVAVGVFVWLLAGFLDFDAKVPADGRPHHVAVATDGDRMLWTESPDQECQVVDLATGEPIPLRRVGGSFTRSDSDGDLTGARRFAPGSGDLSVTCISPAFHRPDSGTVVIGPMPHIGSLVAGVLAMILVPGLLGLAGLVILLVNGILWSTRQPRPRGP